MHILGWLRGNLVDIRSRHLEKSALRLVMLPTVKSACSQRWSTRRINDAQSSTVKMVWLCYCQVYKNAGELASQRVDCLCQPVDLSATWPFYLWMCVVGSRRMLPWSASATYYTKFATLTRLRLSFTLQSMSRPNSTSIISLSETYMR